MESAFEQAAPGGAGPAHAVNRFFFSLSGIILCLMAIPIIIDVLLRVAGDASIYGASEMEEIAMIFVVFLSLAFVQDHEDHIRIELIDHLLSKDRLITVELFNALVSGLFFSVVAVCCLTQAAAKTGDGSFAFGVPLSLFIAASALGFFLLAVSLFRQAGRYWRESMAARNISGIILALILALAACFGPWLLKTLGVLPGRLALSGLAMLFLFTLLFFRMPLGFAMGFVGLQGLLLVRPMPGSAFTSLGNVYTTVYSFTLTVIPMFIFMGALCLRTDISKDLFRAAGAWLGRLPAGLSIASVAGCAGFAAVCGDSMATAVAMGSVALPEMRAKKYHMGLACGCLAAGGTLGILIPPSIGFIFYAIITEESVGKLFAAGVIPGIILALLFMAALYIQARLTPALAPRGESRTLSQKFAASKGVGPMLILFLLILGGIFSGWFNPTEGGAVGVGGAAILALARRKLNWATLKDSVTEATYFSSKLLLILVGVGVLGYFLAATRMPEELARLIIGFNLSPHMFFAAVVGLFILLGCIMNVIPMLLLTLPSIYPTVQAMGFDPIWFGVVIVIVMEMGQITPPVGVNVFALNSVARDVPLETIFKGVLPFVAMMLLMVLILTLFPSLATWLPGILFSGM